MADYQSPTLNDAAYSGPQSFDSIDDLDLLDLNLFYGKGSSQLKLTGFDAINNMLLLIMHTLIGEEDFEPTYGSALEALIHEPNDAISRDMAEMEIYTRIRAWVPFIDIAISGVRITNLPEIQALQIIFVYRERVNGIMNSFTTYIKVRG